MNKAFVREPDLSGAANCPKCGSAGSPVSAPTITAHLLPDAVGQVASEAFFCPLASCPVIYFDAFERFVTVEMATAPVYPKELDAPICACFGLTRDDIEADLEEGGVRRVREAVERSRSPTAQCLTKSVSGQSCVAEIQRYYYRRRGELGLS